MPVDPGASYEFYFGRTFGTCISNVVCDTYISLQTSDTSAALLQANMYIVLSLHDARRIPARRARSTHSQALPRVAKPQAWAEAKSRRAPL
jgi:hypothetical protein